MPFSNISTEYHTLIGVNCIVGDEKETISREWAKRFSPYKAFLVEVSEQDSVEKIVTGICELIAQQGITSLADKTCVLAVFMDLTGEPKPELLDTLSKISAKLNSLLHCSITTVLQFGYAGLVGLNDSAPIRANIQTVVAHNENDPTRTQIVLVSKPALAALSYSVWLPAIILLDFMRRQPNPAGELPKTLDGKTNNDVGFLSYREYNEKIYGELQTEAKRLQDKIGNEHKVQFQNYISKLVNEIADGIDKTYPVDGAFQPQHPDMIVPKNKEKKAEKGKYDPYNAAARQTESAVEATRRAINDAVKASFALAGAQADRKLREAIDAAGLGLAAAGDRQFMLGTALTFLNPAPERPLSIDLMRYKSDHTPDIDQYLRKVKDFALFEGREMLYSALRRAYEKIDAGEFEKQIAESNAKLKQISAKLQGLLSEEEFFTNADSGMLTLTSTFSADGLNEAISRDYFILRGEELQKKCQMKGYSSTIKYYIDEKTGNIQGLDDAPMKVIRLTLLDCTQENLENLIKG